MTDEEISLIRRGALETINMLRFNSHSDDDHALELADWLKANIERIVCNTVEQVMVSRARRVG